MTSSGCFSIVSAARAIAAAVFRPIGSTTTRDVRRLLADESLVAPVGDHRDVVGQAGQALDRPLQEGALAEQRQERLGALGAAQRVEAGPAAAGQDDGIHAPLV